ncbi:hypothetical protein QPM17_23030 [Marinobacter sp. TBZ242]|uniref:Uncharacterized protein n=1 Tax=Marinobacter azerbaijanicus TaxID=3050455 RepID=A0ABT7IIL1_9GAMM|nr:hypothetical protein [Marinobacter sp. TBZ242]MDL0434019.1 hypothetical protein [Marinobacter sp. TBZ242]
MTTEPKVCFSYPVVLNIRPDWMQDAREVKVQELEGKGLDYACAVSSGCYRHVTVYLGTDECIRGSIDFNCEDGMRRLVKCKGVKSEEEVCLLEARLH